MAVHLATQPGLFPEPLERSARFLDDARIELTRWWDDAKPKALVIGHNPSVAAATREDPTSLWWNRWFKHWGFGGYSAGNLYPFVTPDPNQLYTRLAEPTPADVDMMLRNLDEIVAMASRAKAVFVCFGNLPRDPTWVVSVIDALKDRPLWCWGTTKSGMPTHPMARGKHRIDQLVPAQEWRWPL